MSVHPRPAVSIPRRSVGVTLALHLCGLTLVVDLDMGLLRFVCAIAPIHGAMTALGLSSQPPWESRVEQRLTRFSDFRGPGGILHAILGWFRDWIGVCGVPFVFVRAGAGAWARSTPSLRPPHSWAAARRRGEMAGLGNPPRPPPAAAPPTGVDVALPLQCTSLWQNSRRLAAPMVVPKKVGFAARAPRARLGNS